MADLPRKTGSRERVRAYLAERGLDRGVHEFERSTKTAAEAADAMGCELGQIVKSLVWVVGDRVVVTLVAGDRRGDASAIAARFDASEAHFADADTVRAATGYAIGGVSPFDLPHDVAVLIDDSLARFDVVYPAAGTPSSMVRLTYGQLLELTAGQVARISQG